MERLTDTDIEKLRKVLRSDIEFRKSETIYIANAVGALERKLYREEASKVGLMCKKYNVWRIEGICREHKKLLVAADEMCCSDLVCCGRCPGNEMKECWEGKGWRNMRTKIARLAVFRDERYLSYTTVQLREILHDDKK